MWKRGMRLCTRSLHSQGRSKWKGKGAANGSMFLVLRTRCRTSRWSWERRKMLMWDVEARLFTRCCHHRDWRVSYRQVGR